MTNLDCDFLVIGAGMAGVSAAAALAPRGRVVVAEQEEHPGYHATGRSAAIFADSYGNDLVRRLSAESRRLMEGWRDAGGEGDILRRRGLLYVTLEASSHQAFDDLDDLPRLSAAEACALVPILKEEAIAHARWESGAADIDVHALLDGYLRTLRAKGGALLRQAPVRSARRLDGRWRIAAGDQVICADVVVNAAGAWAGEVGALFGASPPGLVPMRRSAAIIDGPAGQSVDHWPMVVDMAESLYFKPEAGKLMISPADAEPSPPCDAFADDLAIAIAVDRFETITTLQVRHVRTPWAGLRTFTPDQAPLIGFDPHVEGLFWLAGQGGFGIQTAPAAARLAAALIAGGDTGFSTDMDTLVTGVSPARFR